MRTQEQITSEMDAIQSQFPQLRTLTGGASSQVSFYRLIKSMWVLLVQTVDQRVDTMTADVTASLASAQTGSLSWYVNQLKSFQFGDPVGVYNGQTGYATVNPDKQIVAQAAVSENDGRLLMKVAKGGGANGGYQALASNELDALKEYVRQVKYAGVAADVISLQADELKLIVTVAIDKQVLTTDGYMLATPTRLPAVEAAIEYARNLPFDSVLNWTGMTDLAQTKPGVKDFQIVRAFIRPAGTQVWNEFTRQTTSRAGHVVLLQNESTFTYV